MPLDRFNFVPPTLLLDSISDAGKRIATFKLRYPKMVHGDFMTHRVFSRNASSSRAIPTKRLSMTTADDMYVPEFRINRAGMQPGDYLSPKDQATAQRIWRETAELCLHSARLLSEELGVHKQWANRMIEWFGYINVIVTATDFDNFIGLREELTDDLFPMAQDEIYFQAIGISDLLASHTPKRLRNLEWHLPLILDEERSMSDADLLRISAARCAGISYETVSGEPMTIERANKVCDKLLTSRRVHASPFEHQALADPFNWHPEFHGNFDGWVQNRKLIPNECIKKETS
jgi:hypothetical protein